MLHVLVNGIIIASNQRGRTVIIADNNNIRNEVG
jgi:type II secretory pathway component PulC